jgi:hypothetical protein
MTGTTGTMEKCEGSEINRFAPNEGRALLDVRALA